MTAAIDLDVEACRITKTLGGIWNGRSGLALCPAHRDRLPSLSISAGRKTLLFHCFAGCDFTDVVREIRRLGALSRDPVPVVCTGRVVDVRDLAPIARKLWLDARDVPGTLAERYLRGRGLRPPWTDLRYHPRAPIGAGVLVTFRPTLIAAVRDCTGLVAVHRIVLDPLTAGKATDLDNPKLTLGKPKRGAVRLFKATRTLGIAEGVETAKSAARMLGIPVWAALGNERFPLIDIPFDVTRLVLLPDRGRAGDRAAALAEEAHHAPNRTIETIPPPADFDDWNEADQAEYARIEPV